MPEMRMLGSQAFLGAGRGDARLLSKILFKANILGIMI